MKNRFHQSLHLFIALGTAFILMGNSGQRGGNQATGAVECGATGAGSRSGTNAVSSDVTNTMKKKGMAAREKNDAATLSPYAEELASIIKFDRQVFIMVKETTQQHIHRLIGYDENGYQIIAPGITVPVPEDKTETMLTTLRQKLSPLHYMPFVVEMNGGLKIDKIGILKGTDQYDILRVMHTNGDDHDISNDDIIDRLKEWEMCWPFDIIGADNDWVEIEFKSLPKDLKAFVEEVYEFSPDAVDQGWGSVEGLITEIKKTNRLFLWWE